MTVGSLFPEVYFPKCQTISVTIMAVCCQKPFIHWNPKKRMRWHILPNLAGDSQAFLLRFPLPTRHSKPWGEPSVSSHPFTSLSLLPQSPRTQHQPPSPSSSNNNKVSQVENNVLLSSSHLKPHVVYLYPSPPRLLSVPHQWQGTWRQWKPPTQTTGRDLRLDWDIWETQANELIKWSAVNES